MQLARIILIVVGPVLVLSLGACGKKVSTETTMASIGTKSSLEVEYSVEPIISGVSFTTNKYVFMDFLVLPSNSIEKMRLVAETFLQKVHLNLQDAGASLYCPISSNPLGELVFPGGTFVDHWSASLAVNNTVDLDYGFKMSVFIVSFTPKDSSGTALKKSGKHNYLSIAWKPFYVKYLKAVREALAEMQGAGGEIQVNYPVTSIGLQDE